MGIFLTVLYTFILFFIIQKSKFFSAGNLDKRFFHFAFLLKLFAGAAIWHIYEYHYHSRETSDIFRYYDDAGVVYSSLKSNPRHFFEILFNVNMHDPELLRYFSVMGNWNRQDHFSLFNDNQFVIRLNAIIYLFSFGHYAVHVLFFNFLGLIGLTAIYKTMMNHFPEKKLEMYAAVFLLPSVLFWTSGVLKDPLIFLCLGLALYHFDRGVYHSAHKGKSLLFFAFFLLMLMLVKSQVFIVLLPAWAACYFFRKSRGMKLFARFSATCIIYFILLVNFQYIFPSKNFLQTLTDKQQDFKRLAYEAKAGSYLELYPLKPDLESFFHNLPQAYRNTFIRPVSITNSSPLIMLSSAESLLLLALALICLLSFDRKKFMAHPYFFFAVYYVLFLYALIGLVTPVLGAIVRYRAQALPFLALALVMMYDKDTFVMRFPFIKNIISRNS